MGRLKLGNNLLLCGMILLTILSCKKNYSNNEAKELLGNKINEFCVNKSINVNNIEYDTLFKKYKVGKEYQYNLSYYTTNKLDTTIITCALFTDDGEIRFIEVKNLNNWKAK